MKIFTLFLFACSTSGPVTIETDCAALKDTSKRDSCLHEQILLLPASKMNIVIQSAKQIEDLMIRGAAVSEWVKNHNNDINQRQGQQLCTLLDGRDRSYCLRRLSSPHLRRD